MSSLKYELEDVKRDKTEYSIQNEELQAKVEELNIELESFKQALQEEGVQSNFYKRYQQARATFRETYTGKRTIHMGAEQLSRLSMKYQ